MSLLEFYGEECPHCIDMRPLVEKLEKEEGAKFEKFETWHNDENEMKRQAIDKGMCGGVPFFYNTDNNTFVCGAVSYDEFKKWAMAGHGNPKTDKMTGM